MRNRRAVSPSTLSKIRQKLCWSDVSSHMTGCVCNYHCREGSVPQRSDRQALGKLSSTFLPHKGKWVFIFPSHNSKLQGPRRTSAVQSGPESSESEISEYSDDRFLSSDFILVKNPEKENDQRKRVIRIGTKCHPKPVQLLSHCFHCLHFILPPRTFSLINQDTDWSVFLKLLGYLSNMVYNPCMGGLTIIYFFPEKASTLKLAMMLFTFCCALFVSTENKTKKLSWA